MKRLRAAVRTENRAAGQRLAVIGELDVLWLRQVGERETWCTDTQEAITAEVAAALGITQSMKRPREIGDNAFIESFFHSMKAEAIHARVFPHDRALREAIARYIRRYNLSRLHSSLGYRSPIDYEKTVA